MGLIFELSPSMMIVECEKNRNNMGTEQSLVYTLGEYSLDVVSRRLTCDGQTTDVTPKLMALLVLMAENQDKVLTKQEILDGVWTGRVVSDTTFYKLIERARQLFNQKPASCVHIQTIHGQGYQLMVQSVVPETAGHHVVKAVGSLAALLCLVMLIWTWLADQPEQINDLQLRFTGDMNSATSKGLQQGLKDVFKAHMYQAKKANDYVHDPQGLSLVVDHQLAETNLGWSLSAKITHEGHQLAATSITSDHMAGLLDPYLDWLADYEPIAEMMFTESWLPEFPDSTQALAIWMEGMGHWETQNYQAAIGSFESALTLDPGFEWARLYLAVVNRKFTRIDYALAALNLIQTDGASDHLKTTHGRIVGFTHLSNNQTDVAKRYFYQAEQLALKNADVENQFKINNGLGYLYMQLGWYSRSDDYLHNAMLLAEQLSDQTYQTRATTNACLLFYKMGRVSEARDACLKSMGQLDLTSGASSLVYNHHWLALIHLEMNDIKAAREAVHQALNVSAGLANLSSQSYAHLAAFHLAMRLADEGKAESHLTQLEQHVTRINDPDLVTALMEAKGLLAMHQGELSLAQAFFQQMQQSAVNEHHHGDEVTAACHLIRVHQAQNSEQLSSTVKAAKVMLKNSADIRFNACLAEVIPNELSALALGEVMQLTKTMGLEYQHERILMMGHPIQNHQ
jgi:DNA-binding winged helix-turn-helix (wHTH) protein/tetratricopeptide (TPR) repeat protein